MLNMQHSTATSAACLRLNRLSDMLWERQHYLANVRGKNNLELDFTPAELVSDLAQEADRLIAEILLILDLPPETPGVRRAMNRMIYATTT